MTTETTTTTTAPAATQTTQASTEPDAAALRTTLAALQADNATLAKTNTDLTGQLGAALRERDTHKAAVDKLQPVAAEAEALRGKVEKFTNDARETALVEQLRSQLPGAEPLAIRGVLSTLSEQGKVNRFAEDPKAEAAKAFEVIKAEAPSLLRPPTTAGGSAIARPSTRPAYLGPFSK